MLRRIPLRWKRALFALGVLELAAWIGYAVADRGNPGFQSSTLLVINHLETKSQPDWLAILRSDLAATLPGSHFTFQESKSSWLALRACNPFVILRSPPFIALRSPTAPVVSFYELTVVASDPSSATRQLKKLTEVMEKKANEVCRETEEQERTERVAILKAEAVKARSAGNERTAQAIDLTRLMEERSIRCSSAPLRCIDPVADTATRTNSYASTHTQFSIVGLALLSTFVSGNLLYRPKPPQSVAV